MVNYTRLITLFIALTRNFSYAVSFTGMIILVYLELSVDIRHHDKLPKFLGPYADWLMVGLFVIFVCFFIYGFLKTPNIRKTAKWIIIIDKIWFELVKAMFFKNGRFFWGVWPNDSNAGQDVPADAQCIQKPEEPSQIAAAGNELKRIRVEMELTMGLIATGALSQADADNICAQYNIEAEIISKKAIKQPKKVVKEPKKAKKT